MPTLKIQVDFLLSVNDEAYRYQVVVQMPMFARYTLLYPRCHCNAKIANITSL